MSNPPVRHAQQTRAKRFRGELAEQLVPKGQVGRERAYFAVGFGQCPFLPKKVRPSARSDIFRALADKKK